MFRVSPEAAASAATFNARSKQSRPEPSQSDGFSALVDSNAPDSQRDAAPASDVQAQRLDGDDTHSKADNRSDTRAGGRSDNEGKQTLDTAKPASGSDAKADARANSDAASKAKAKADSKPDSKTASKDDATPRNDNADASTVESATLTVKAAAEAAAGKIEIAANAKIVATGGDAKEISAKPTGADKASDADATDAAAPAVTSVLADAASLVAAVVPVAAAADVQSATPSAKSDAQIAGVQAAKPQSISTAATAATLPAAASATSDAKAADNSEAPVTPSVPTTSSSGVAADTLAVATDATATTQANDAAKTTAEKGFVQPLAAGEIPAQDVDIANAEIAAAQPITTAKPKAASVAANVGTSTLTDPDSKADAIAASSLPGQTGDAAKPRGAEHLKGESDKTAASADKSDAAPSDTKQANAAAPVTHHAPAVPRAEPADLNLQPIQTQQTQPPQAQTQNLTAAPAVQINTTLANTPVPVSGLAVDIALRAAGGSSRFEIRLDPAELGRIDVRLDVDKHGNVTSHLTVEKPATLDMLRRDAPQLQQALQDAGLKTGDSGLQFSLRDQSSGRNDDNGSGRNSQRLIISEEDAVPAQIAGRTYGRTLVSSGGVDIRV